jgi:hypothetical protein
MQKLRIVTLSGFRVGDRSRGRYATPAGFPRHECSSYRGLYTHPPKVRDLSIVQGPFSVDPCQTLMLRFATFASLYRGGRRQLSSRNAASLTQTPRRLTSRR